MPTFDCEGDTLWYDLVGEGELVIALHGGLGLDHTCFRPWLDPLGEQHTLAYLDFRANGRSSGDGADLTMQRLSEDVDALRAHLGHDRAWVLGHSYGGFVALEYALRFPDRIHGMVLLDTDSTAPSPETMAAGLQRLGVPAEAMSAFADEVETTEDMFRLFEVVGPWYLPHSDRSAARSVLGATIFRKEGSEGGERALRGWDVTARLPEITVPALVVSGADDFMFPPERTERLGGALSRSTVAVIEGSGHLPFVESQDTVLTLIRGFLGRQPDA